MKFISVFLVCAFVVCAMCEPDEKVVQIVNQCKEETSATPEDVVSLMKHEVPVTRTAKCLHACFMKKMNIIDADNKLNKEGVLAYVTKVAKGDEAKLKLGNDIFTTCSTLEVPADECEAAAVYTTCAQELANERKISLTDK